MKVARVAVIAASLGFPAPARAQLLNLYVENLWVVEFQPSSLGMQAELTKSGEAGKEYEIRCHVRGYGWGKILVNGALIASQQSNGGKLIQAPWKPLLGGTHTLKCEANSSTESGYSSQTTKQFAVSGLQIDPDKVAISAGALNPGALNPSRGISSNIAKKLVVGSDIRVQGLEVHPVGKDGVPKTNTVQSGKPGRTYQLQCEMDPFGILTADDATTVTSVRFLFRIDGIVVKDVQVPVGSGAPVDVGAEWTPQEVGIYPLSCEANPLKTFQEASFANNKKEILFPVQTGGN